METIEMKSLSQEIKDQMYDILSEDLQYNVMDNPYGTKEKTFPYVLLRISNITRQMYKKSFLFNFKFSIDIFSNYNGEYEVLQMEQDIFEAFEKLYQNENITLVTESGFRLLDDKSTGVVRKHGVINYTVLCAGGVVEEDEENSNET